MIMTVGKMKEICSCLPDDMQIWHQNGDKIVPSSHEGTGVACLKDGDKPLHVLAIVNCKSKPSICQMNSN